MFHIWPGFTLMFFLIASVYVIFLILVIYVIIKVLAGLTRKDPEEILKERYARGEINKQEFEEKIKDLQNKKTED